MARIADVPAPIGELWDPATCPADLLPWLAWALSADRWESFWTDDQKRATVASAIADQRKKGTPASVSEVLASFDALLTLTEWFDMVPQGAPHTFEVSLPVIDQSGNLGGFRTSAEFAEAIIRDVKRTKPARSHFKLVQYLTSAATVDAIGEGRLAGYIRGDFAADETTGTQDWSATLLAETGEPIQAESGELLEEATP